MVKFLISNALLTVGIVLVVFLGGEYQWWAAVPTFSLVIILFLSISTGVIYYLLRKLSPASITQPYLLSIVLKLIGYGIFILVIIYIDKSSAFENALVFMVSYLLFTALEVGFLFNRINR